MPGIVYAAKSDLVNLGVPAAAIAMIGDPVITQALTAASAKVDMSLRSQFTFPITAFGQDIVQIVCILAAYDLLVVRGYNPAAAADLNIRQRYEDLVGRPGMDGVLTKIAKGELSPDITDSRPEPQEGVGFVPIPITSSSRGWTARQPTTFPPRPRGPFVAD